MPSGQKTGWSDVWIEAVVAARSSSRQVRQEIVHSFYANLKKVQNRGGMSGEARASRWKENQGGKDELAARGNAGNAAAVAAAKAHETTIYCFRSGPTYSEL